MDELFADFAFEKHENAWHLEAVAETTFFGWVGRSVPFDDGGLEAANPIHEAENLARRGFYESKFFVKNRREVADVMDGQEAVFFEKRFRHFVGTHVNEDDSRAAFF